MIIKVQNRSLRSSINIKLMVDHWFLKPEIRIKIILRKFLIDLRTISRMSVNLILKIIDLLILILKWRGSSSYENSSRISDINLLLAPSLIISHLIILIHDILKNFPQLFWIIFPLSFLICQVLIRYHIFILVLCRAFILKIKLLNSFCFILLLVLKLLVSFNV